MDDAWECGCACLIHDMGSAEAWRQQLQPGLMGNTDTPGAEVEL